MISASQVSGMALVLALFAAAALANPQATGGQCQVGRGCIWKQFRQRVDWDFLDKRHGNCDHCRKMCARVPGCTGYECGANYCASWMHEACNQTRISNNEGITTCKMKGNMTSEPERPRASCKFRCGQGGMQLPGLAFEICSCKKGCRAKGNCCRNYHVYCDEDDSPVSTLPSTNDYGHSYGFHSWFYIAPAIMGTSITSFCVLFVWFRYQHRRRAAAAAQRQFQQLEEISQFDPVVAISSSSHEGTYAVPVPESTGDGDSFVFKSTLGIPLASTVEAAAIPPGMFAPGVVAPMAAVVTTGSDE